MEGITILLIVIVTIVFTIVMLCFVLPALKKNGVNVEAALGGAKDALAAVDKTLDIIRPFLPTKAAPGLALFDKILDAAAIGVGNAEQLYHVGQLEGDKRKQEAEAYILSVLKLAGIEATPEVMRLVDGAIEAKVLDLGHKDDLTKFGLSVGPLIPANVAKTLFADEAADPTGEPIS
jgi:hypothetical protein